ncbi:sarcosine oxidase subunit gamma [Defluviimonas sp. WL0075]|uniref:Sarcosine oxidase subunit gamma n=1 Tax=Albidovulum sediminicola TaxID=2984331 RepID=A0ABT2Z5C4_9RHOB|nr:sarcosine oxidase subunit gamma [Defluviimonas sp. WL0075]MCV2866352.1 sarcosine oxidase subunit gamma [Defluviimonas sp. WL0075]
MKIHRQEISALFDLKGDPDALRQWAGRILPAFPDAPNRKSVSDRDSLYHIGRNHWILRAEIEREEPLSAALKPDAAPADISIVRISDTLTFFDVTGPDAAQIMAIACPLDLHPATFGDTAVTFTEVFGLKALLCRVADGFEFAVEQSFGNMVSDYLARATAD